MISGIRLVEGGYIRVELPVNTAFVFICVVWPSVLAWAFTPISTLYPHYT